MDFIEGSLIVAALFALIVMPIVLLFGALAEGGPVESLWDDDCQVRDSAQSHNEKLVARN